jgi:preprotein translocase subunit SecE
VLRAAPAFTGTGGRVPVESAIRADMKEKIIAFFTDVVKEMKKVTWPKKDDLRDSTVIVLVVCLLISAFVFVVDTTLSEVLKRIL